MRSPRPYREAMAESQAIEQLELGAGHQFDPDVVEAFLRALPHDACQERDSE